MTHPPVTIVVPTYNGARFLRESLDSILAQRYAPIEVIVMDDASTDETPLLVAQYGPAVRYVRQSANRGQFRNVNDGIGLAQGEFIAVYHADDVYTPTIVEREVEFLNLHPDAGAVFCLDVFIDAHGREYGKPLIPAELRGGGTLSYALVLDLLLRHGNTFLRAPGAMVRAAAYRAVGLFRLDLEPCADLEMWLRIARRYPIGLIDEHLYGYRHFESQVTSQYETLRVVPHRHFEIMDACIVSDRSLIRAAAHRVYEVRRAEDIMMRSTSHYIRGELKEARRTLMQVTLKLLLSARRPNSGRLLALLFLLRVLTRLPRIPRVAERMRRRWHRRAPGMLMATKSGRLRTT